MKSMKCFIRLFSFVGVSITVEGFTMLFQTDTSDFSSPTGRYSPHFLHDDDPKKIHHGIKLSMVQNEDSFVFSGEKLQADGRSKTIRKNKIGTKNTKVKSSKTYKKNDLVAKRKSHKFEPEPEPIHFWANHTDEVVLKDDGEVKMVKFTVKGNPVPLARHRTYRGYVFNPSAKKQQQFASVVLNMLPSSCFMNSTSILGSTTRTIDHVVPIFNGDEIIDVKLLCRMKRPKNHFRASIPGPGRLKETAPDSLFVTRKDVDNLAKFVLDSLNQIIYVDDKQIASLQILKIYDDDHCSSGATDVLIQRLTYDHINQYHAHFNISSNDMGL
jgi:hypothetical protein